MQFTLPPCEERYDTLCLNKAVMMGWICGSVERQETYVEPFCINLFENDNLENLVGDRMLVLKFHYRLTRRSLWAGLKWLRIEHSENLVSNIRQLKSKSSKDIPVTGRGGPQGCGRLRLPHLLDNRHTDGGKFVSPTRRPLFTPHEDFWYSFLLEAESTPGL
jgi:hypothetical protein